MTCRCPRSAEACWRQATTTNALRQPVCAVCDVGCGELRFGLPGDLWVMARVVTTHAPLAMEYVP
jgi:hypothetical protein